MSISDEQFEATLFELSCIKLAFISDAMRARDTAQREALARVEAAYANRLRNVKQLESERDTAQTQLAEAVGLLRKVRMCGVLGESGPDVDSEIGQFLARQAQAEQQEAQDVGPYDPGQPCEGCEVCKAHQEAQGAQAGEFWTWLDLAYRDGSKGEEPKFTKYNMEVAYRAGTEATRAALATQPAEWVDPVALHPAENLYNQGFADGVSEAKRLNAVRGAEHA